MKKLFVLLFCLVLLACPFIANAEQVTEAVVEMTCIVKLPDVIREGKYTGQVVNGVPHGYGVFVTENSEGIQWHYLGEWVDGQMTGEGGQYWVDGRSQVGTYKNGDLQCGHVWESDGSHRWYDRTINEHGCYSYIVYRTDGTKYLESCVDNATGKYHIVTTYTKNGEVFFSGTLGEGFNWNQIYID